MQWTAYDGKISVGIYSDSVDNCQGVERNNEYMYKRVVEQQHYK